jgi:hypothetical protein
MSTSLPRTLRHLVSTWASALVLTGAGAAAASETYPGKIMEYLETKGSKVVPPCPVDCLLCHTSPNGGSAFMRIGLIDNVYLHSTPEVPFGAGQPSSIIPLFDRLERLPCPDGTTGPCDYDKDGKSDVQEIREGTDPNANPGRVSDCPHYGCGASVATTRPTERRFDGALVIGLLGIAAFFARRRR